MYVLKFLLLFVLFCVEAKAQITPDTIRRSAFKLDYNKFKWEKLIVLTQNPDTLRLTFLSKTLQNYRPRIISRNEDVNISIVRPNVADAYYWLIVFEFDNSSEYSPVPFDVYVDLERTTVVPNNQSLVDSDREWRIVTGAYLVGSHNIPYKPFLRNE